MRLLVTGCAGFVGWRVSRLLLDEGHDVVGLDSLNDAYDPALKRWRLDDLRGHASFSFHRADLSQREAARSVFEDGPFDGVLNLAARAGVRASIEDPWVYVDTNVTGTLNVLELMRAHDVKRLVLASTSSLYGAHNPRPFSEAANTDRPLSPYAASKKAAESLAATYAHLYGLNASVVRYFTVYGPAGRPDMSMFRFVRWIAEGEPLVILGDGEQERDYTFVDDIARGTRLALDSRGYEVYNLGGERPITVNALIGIIERKLGKKALVEHRPAHRADMQATWADTSKARRALGWEPRVGIEEGVRATIDWYIANREWARKLDVGPT